jgi:small subunit ribosomal protein S6
MRRYETIIITDPDLSAEQRDPVLQRVTDVVKQGDGYLALTDEWGARKLAYEIKKKDRGYYIRFDFCATGAVVNEMERFFRIDDRVLKYMTVLLDKTADIEKIKEEIAAAQSKTDKAKAQAEAAAAPTPLEEPAEAQTEAAATPTPSEEPAEAQTEAAATPTPSEEPAEAQTEAGEIPPPQEPAETEEGQTPESEVGQSEAPPTETEEEKK